MSDILFRSDIKVERRRNTPDGDASVAEAAWISTENEPRLHDEGRIPGLINYLIEHRHGTPFEHNSVTFRVEAPIMVFREWHRHRIQSYNEQSGRYTQFKPVFYVPAPERPLVNIGTSARPMMGPAEPQIVEVVGEELMGAYTDAWTSYQKLLNVGIANEVARLVLPVATYTSMYATANLRAWLHFISLRTSEENAHWQGHPQHEIVLGAKEVEEQLTLLFPIVMKAFNEHGRVAP